MHQLLINVLGNNRWLVCKLIGIHQTRDWLVTSSVYVSRDFEAFMISVYGLEEVFIKYFNNVHQMSLWNFHYFQQTKFYRIHMHNQWHLRPSQIGALCYSVLHSCSCIVDDECSDWSVCRLWSLTVKHKYLCFSLQVPISTGISELSMPSTKASTMLSLLSTNT